MSNGRRRSGWRAALVAAALVIASTGWAVANRNAIVAWSLVWQLGRMGIDDASLRVESVGLSGIAIRDVELGDGDLLLRALDLEWSAQALQARRFDAVRVHGLSVRGALGESGVRLGALDALRGGTAAAPSGPPRFPVLPAARLEIEQANFTLETDAGPTLATVAIHLDEAGDGRVALAITALPALETALGIAAEPFAVGGPVSFRPERLQLTLAPAPFSLTLAGAEGVQRITGKTPEIDLSAVPGEGERLRVVTKGGQVSLPDLGLVAEGLVLDARLASAAALPAGSLAVASLRDTSESPRFPTVGLRADFFPSGGGLAFEGALTGLDGRLTLQLDGLHDPARGAGRADLELSPLEFGAGELGPGDLLPRLADLLQSADGTVEASGEISWSGGEVTGFMDIGAVDLTLQTRAALIDRLNAAVRIEGPWPLRIPSGQLLSMARLDFGLELTNGLVRYALRDDGVVVIDAAEWEFAGGSLRSDGEFDLGAEEQQMTLTVRDVDLAELLELVNLDGLSGTGRLNGEIPLSLGHGSIEIRNAVLETPSGGGWIRYQPVGEATAVASGAGMAFGDLLEALRSFRYDQLRLTVNGDAQGSVVVALSLQGANPEHRDAQPYEFNLNVDGRLADLVRQSGAAYRIPAQIEEQLGRIGSEARSPAAAPLHPVPLLDATGGRGYDRPRERQE